MFWYILCGITTHALENIIQTSCVPILANDTGHHSTKHKWFTNRHYEISVHHFDPCCIQNYASVGKTEQLKVFHHKLSIVLANKASQNLANPLAVRMIFLNFATNYLMASSATRPHNFSKVPACTLLSLLDMKRDFPVLQCGVLLLTLDNNKTLKHLQLQELNHFFG